MHLAEMTSPMVGEIARDAVALLPIAATEQHGHHLAVSTDTSLATAIAQRAEAAMPSEVVLCPTLPFGSSHHHLGFAGTLSISHQTYVQVLVDLVDSLLQSGFRRILLLNGHGGNITPGEQALSILSHRHDDALQPHIALATYWLLTGPPFCGERPMESPELSHACEYETSMMLYLLPERVDLTRATADEPPAQQRGVTLSKRTHYISGGGASGRPELATAEKGEHLVEAATASVLRFLNEFKSLPFSRDLR